MSKSKQLELEITLHAQSGPMPDEAAAIFNFAYNCFGHMLGEYDVIRVWEIARGRLLPYIPRLRKSPTQSELRRVARGYAECRRAGYGL